MRKVESDAQGSPQHWTFSPGSSCLRSCSASGVSEPPYGSARYPHST
jgi:hypothetical protein